MNASTIVDIDEMIRQFNGITPHKKEPVSIPTNLHKIIKQNDVNTLKSALSIKQYAINTQDELGNTPLHIAAACSNLAALKMLKDHGEADLNIKNAKGETFLDIFLAQNKQCKLENSDLHEIIKIGSITDLDCLLDSKKIDINKKDSSGNTPSHTAILCSNLPALRTLIDHGADLNILNTTGKTVLDIFVKRMLSAIEEDHNPHHLPSLEVYFCLLSKTKKSLNSVIQPLIRLANSTLAKRETKYQFTTREDTTHDFDKGCIPHFTTSPLGIEHFSLYSSRHKESNLAITLLTFLTSLHTTDNKGLIKDTLTKTHNSVKECLRQFIKQGYAKALLSNLIGPNIPNKGFNNLELYPHKTLSSSQIDKMLHDFYKELSSTKKALSEVTVEQPCNRKEAIP